jgi:hypothetical protein
VTLPGLIGIIGAIVAVAVLAILFILWRRKANTPTLASADEMAAGTPSDSSGCFLERAFLTESNPIVSTLWDEGELADALGSAGNFVE